MQQSQSNLKCALNDSNWMRWPVKEDTQQQQQWKKKKQQQQQPQRKKETQPQLQSQSAATAVEPINQSAHCSVCVPGGKGRGSREELAQSAANGLGISCFLIFPN